MVGENCQLLQDVILTEFQKSKMQSRRLRNGIESSDLVILVDNCVSNKSIGESL